RRKKGQIPVLEPGFLPSTMERLSLRLLSADEQDERRMTEEEGLSSIVRSWPMAGTEDCSGTFVF
ncbi:MAG: hypothetical protein RMN24_09945, partial [Anaerolineae bacterium]|nr:hypothetical protein [Anaerolineae bacterium]